MLELYTTVAVPLCAASLMPIVAWIVWIFWGFNG